MKSPLIERASGTTNGVNQVFQTSRAYAAGTVRVFLNGVLMRQDFDDGWLEQGAQNVQLRLAPRSGDVVQIYYLPL